MLHGPACGTGETLPVCRTAALCPQIVVAGTQSEVHWQREPRMPSKSHELQTSQNGITEELPGAAGGIRPYNMPGDQHRPYVMFLKGVACGGPTPKLRVPQNHYLVIIPPSFPTSFRPFRILVGMLVEMME